ncbi:MAG TPA: phosphatase PAP2 family protein [Xanthobacteraceae bacterium]|nr:phosphatase PAP2 family protein [Xanthobacteraceae bacterium]
MPAIPDATAINPNVLRTGSRLVWTLIAALAIAAALACWAAGLSVDCRRLPSLAVAVAISAPVALFYRLFRPDPGIFYSTESITQIFLISIFGALLAYGAAAFGLPLHDAELLTADRWLGFDPRAYLDFVYAQPLLTLLCPIAYLSMIYQTVIVFVVLSLMRRIDRLHDFCVALVVSLAITIAIFALYPALGWYGYLAVDPADYPKLPLFWNFVPHLEAVRAGTLHVIPLGDLRGIISFPSYHTAAAMLAVWAIWPVRLARWPMLALNVLMVASAPIEGAHYLVDLGGGLVVGVCAILAASAARNAIRLHWAGRTPAMAPAASALPARRTWEGLHAAHSI